MNYEQFKIEHEAWAKHNFPNTLPHQPLLGIGEEVGELMHAHLKGEQNIRHTEEEILDMKIDSIGDILVYLRHYCMLNHIDFMDCLEQAWEQVKDRDWIRNPKGGILICCHCRGSIPFGKSKEVDGKLYHEWCEGTPI